VKERFPSKEELEKFVSETLSKIPQEEIDNRNKEEVENSAKEYEKFLKHFDEGICYLCGRKLDHVNFEEPCFHWFLRRNNRLKKKHFEKIFKDISYTKIQAYLRWIASTQKSLNHINDIDENIKNPQNFEATIRFENLQWSFACSESDIIGHGKQSNFPHFHFEMKIDSKPFIRFSDFHIKILNEDLFTINMSKFHPDKFKHNFGQAVTFKNMFEEFTPEELIDNATINYDETEKTEKMFNMQTVLIAEEGNLISGDDIADMIEESKRTGVSIAKLSQKLEGVRQQTVISPTEQLVEHSERSNPRKKQKKIEK
jgi:hypothetical protein